MPRGIPGSGSASTKAAHNPVVASRVLDATQQEINGAIGVRNMRSDGPARSALDPLEIEPVDSPVLDSEHMANLQFYEEPVTVHIHTTTDKTAEQVFEVFNNGTREVFRRGETKTVKRKFVEQLCRAKTTVYDQQEGIDAQGIRYMKQIPVNALRYPFSVVRDDHPRGADWLKASLAMA